MANCNNEYKSDYRQNECPTGEEVNNIIKFWFKFISENFKAYNRILEEKVGKMEKMIAALAATSAAILVIAIISESICRRRCRSGSGK